LIAKRIAKFGAAAPISFALQVIELDASIIVAAHGWAIGGSFQRALLCDSGSPPLFSVHAA
jgi:hypothetical protein